MPNAAGLDLLTGLPNGPLLRDRLDQALAQCRRRAGSLALLQINLQRLAPTVAELGEGGRDRLLQAIATRLRAQLRGADTIARIDGDSFALLVPDAAGHEAVAMVARKILTSIESGFLLDGRTVRPTACLGIALFPPHGDSFDQLLHHAQAAAAHAEATGVAMHLFTGSVEAPGHRPLSAHDLDTAIEQAQLSLVYQPQIDLRRRQVVGFEALLRWRHPTLGEIDPAGLIEMAEAEGQIRRVGQWVLDQACSAAANWPGGPLGAIRVAVNFSTAQMAGDDLPRVVAEALQRSGLPADRLELELTERSILQGSEQVVAMLRRLRATGITIALDDFGTGYASLQHLDRFPLDVLKIDRSFVTGLGHAENSTTRRAIVQGVVELAHRLGLRVIAEGVENEDELALLDSLGCDEVQGHALGKPLGAGEVTSWLRSGAPLAITP